MKTRDRYKVVNETWPQQILPALEPVEAMRAAKRLLAAELGCKYLSSYGWQVTSGSRHTYPRSGTWYVNPERGWKDLVHALSHYVHRRKSASTRTAARLRAAGRRLRPHHWLHANIEKRMIRTVVERGWLVGALRRPVAPEMPVSPAELRSQKLARRLEQKARLERKIKGLRTRLRKCVASIRALERPRTKTILHGLLGSPIEVELVDCRTAAPPECGCPG